MQSKLKKKRNRAEVEQFGHVLSKAERNTLVRNALNSQLLDHNPEEVFVQSVDVHRKRVQLVALLPGQTVQGKLEQERTKEG